jgi:ABC-type phosphate transport system ATPase subunit
MDIDTGGYRLTNLTKINVILGKNGCGKSTLLKAVERTLDADGFKKYITPERGGVLIYEPNVEQNLNSNAGWLGELRRQNQFPQFRQQSIVQFRRLELAVLRASERNRGGGFQSVC